MSHLALANPGLFVAVLEGAQIVAIVLIVAGAGLLYVIWRGQVGGREVPQVEPKSVATPSSPVAEQRVQNMMRDAEELTSLLAGQMDIKAERLEQLIVEADARIRKLERLTAEIRPIRPEERGGGAEPLNQRIYEMADEGMPPVEIARTLKTQTGKVQLILALRRR